MPYTRKYKRVFRHDDHRKVPPKILRHCRLGSSVSKVFSLTGLIGCMCLFLILFLVFIILVLQPCVNDNNCATNNPCSIDYCQSNFCYHDYKEDCCYTDSDCSKVSCHNVHCNKVTNKCSASQKQNGTSCNDHSRCTVNDRCISGVCMGNTLLCNGNPCMDGKCYKDRGCVYTKKEDNTPCTDSDPCTLSDVCLNGQCTAGLVKSCSSQDDECNVGICDSSSGNCIAMPKPEGSYCDRDVGICDQPNAQCFNGTCKVLKKDCFDSNPCTVEACVDPYGCMVQYNYSNGVCLPGCTQHEDCPGDFLCLDGTCIDIPPDSGINVRFIDYTLENCTNGHRLLMSFIMDAEVDRVQNDVYYRIVREASDITTSSTQPLGFVDEVININSASISSSKSRSAFTLATACQPVTENNCNTIFADRRYKFDLKIMHCLDIDTEPTQCLDPNLHVQTSVDVSISDCSEFSVAQTLHTYGEGILWYNNAKYVGLSNTNTVVLNASAGVRGYAGIETNIYTNDDMIATIYSMRICVPDYQHHLSTCVDGSSDLYCPQKGCFGWSTLDNPLYLSYDIMERGYITAIAKSDIFNAYGCYADDVYKGTDSKKCAQPKCPTAGWPYVMDDGVSMLFEWLNDHQELDTLGLTLIFDIVYRITGCHNNLRSGTEELHKLTKIKIVK